MILANSDRVLGRLLLRSTSPRHSTMSGIPLVFINLFWLASLFALLVGLNLFLKVAPFEFVAVFRKNPLLALFFIVFSSLIFLRLYILPSSALFRLTTTPPVSPHTRTLLLWRIHKELRFNWSADLSTGLFLSIRENV